MAANLAANQKIKFLLGTSTSLETVTIQDGAFYLTTDEHRLYVGDNGKAELLNQDILFVNTKDSLPKTGKPEQLCYIRDTHILTAWIDKGWQQINPNIYIDTLATGVAKADKTATVTTTATFNDKTTTRTTSFALAEGPGIGLEISGQTITVSSTGAGGTNVDLSATSDGNNAKINQKVTPVNASGEEVTDSATTDSITLAAGTNIDNVAVSGDAGSEVITINAKYQGVTDLTVSNAASNGNGFNLGLTQTTTQTVDNQEKFGQKIATFDPIITISNADATANSETTSEIHFKDGKADLSSLPSKKYVADQIAANNKVIDALQFKGVLSDTVPTLTNGQQKVGYVYKIGAVTDATKTISSSVRIGDLAIIVEDTNYTENESGFITAGAKWELIPSGDDLTYSGKAVSGGFEIADSSNTTVGKISFAAGSGTPLTVAASQTSGTEQTVTITHASQTVKSTTETAASYSGSDMTVTVVSGVDINDTGHVTEVKTKSLPIVDTKVSSYADSVAVTDNVATISSAITDSKSSTKDASHKISSETLTLSVNTDKTTLVADMVWGSF